MSALAAVPAPIPVRKSDVAFEIGTVAASLAGSDVLLAPHGWPIAASILGLVSVTAYSIAAWLKGFGQ